MSVKKNITNARNTPEQPQEEITEKVPNSDMPLEYSVGEQLRMAREKKRLSIADVSTKLRIRSIFIEAMERDDFTALPGKTYIGGFMRSYAALIGLNAAQLMAQLAEDSQQTGSDEVQDNEGMPIITDNSASGANTRSSNVKWIVIAAILLCIGAIYHYINAEIIPNIDPHSDSQLIESENSDIETIRQESATPTVQAPSVKPQPEIVVSNADSRIFITFTNNTWIEIFRNDEPHPFVTRIFPAGESYAVPLEQGVTLKLNTGNIGAMVFHLDGVALPRLGPDSAVRRGIELSVENLEKYLKEE